MRHIHTAFSLARNVVVSISTYFCSNMLILKRKALRVIMHRASGSVFSNMMLFHIFPKRRVFLFSILLFASKRGQADFCWLQMWFKVEDVMQLMSRHLLSSIKYGCLKSIYLIASCWLCCRACLWRSLWHQISTTLFIDYNSSKSSCNLMEVDRYLYTCYPLTWSILSDHNSTEDTGKDYKELWNEL